jgi:trehalose-6-phosphatase
MNVAFPSEALVTSTKSQPVIFLDIDGVLKRMGKDRERRVDRDLLARFKRLVEKTNARVVLASTWAARPERARGRSPAPDPFRRRAA